MRIIRLLVSTARIIWYISKKSYRTYPSTIEIMWWQWPTNSMLLITYISKLVVVPIYNPNHASLQDLYHVLSIKKYYFIDTMDIIKPLYFVWSMRVKVCKILEVFRIQTIYWWWLKSVYVMSIEATYVDKIRRNETTNIWHMRLNYISYCKLSVW